MDIGDVRGISRWKSLSQHEGPNTLEWEVVSKVKGVNNKPVCVYCHKIIDRKPIPVPGWGGTSSYAHRNCIRKEKVRTGFRDSELAVR